MSAPIYLDYMATTPLDPRVREAMAPYLETEFGNPHSDHAYGWRAADAIENAAAKVAQLIKADPNEIVFTSGATEANNMAVQGVCRSSQRRGNHVVVSSIEHKCVLQTAKAFAPHGFEIEVVSVGPTGVVDADDFIDRLRPDTALASVMLANNEIGTLQPVAKIAAACRERGIVCHTDAAQAVGKITVDVEALNIDLLSLSGHKLYGPKGIGALFISKHCPIALEPLMHGGAQQDGRRAGTLPPFLCVGLGEACRLAKDILPAELEHIERLRSLLLSRLSDAVPHFVINGDATQSLPGCVNVRFPGADAESLLMSLHRSVAISTSSACNAGLIEPSYVLMALGLTPEEASASIRFGFGRFTTDLEVESAIGLIGNKLAASSPIVAVG